MAAKVGPPYPATRRLAVVTPHTGEALDTVYVRDNVYDVGALQGLSWMLRDHRADAAFFMDPTLFEYIWLLCELAGTKGPVELLSGYRTAATNALLQSEGAARNSFHMQGRAVDIAIPGVDALWLAQAAYQVSALRAAGGTGYYGKRRFVHIDTGSFRAWQG